MGKICHYEDIVYTNKVVDFLQRKNLYAYQMSTASDERPCDDAGNPLTGYDVYVGDWQEEEARELLLLFQEKEGPEPDDPAPSHLANISALKMITPVIAIVVVICAIILFTAGRG